MNSVLIRQNLKRIILTVIFACLATLLAFDAAHAESGHGSQETLRNTNNFYAYVEAGENLDVSIEKVRDDYPSPSKYDATIIVSRPGAADVSCVIQVAQPAGTSCDWTDLTSSASGIWRIRFEVPNQTFEFYSWSIDVQDGVTSLPGRVWSNSYYFSQNGDSASAPQATNSPDIKVWYKSEIGYLYEVDYMDYFGIDSILQANSFGIVEDGTCNTIYKSAAIGTGIGSGIDPEQVVQNCGGEYKVFFEQPAADLPATAQNWDGQTDWINTNPADPTIYGVDFEPEKKGSAAGELEFSTTNYVGTARVRIDTNENGIFTDDVDRSIGVGVLLNQGATLDFDGKDGNGADILGDRKLTFEVSLSRVGEIHFVNSDPEKREGGIQVIRHTGTMDDRGIVYWDDTDFSDTVSTRCSATPVLSGLAGVDSTGGVHGWGIDGCALNGNNNDTNDATNTGSWGDARYIHDWTYAPSPIIIAEYVYTPVPAGVEPTGIKLIRVSPVTIAAGSVLGITTVVLIRRKMHIRRQ